MRSDKSLFSLKFSEADKGKTMSASSRGLSNRMDIRDVVDFTERYVGMHRLRQIDIEIRQADRLFRLPEPAADWDRCPYKGGVFRSYMVSRQLDNRTCLRREMPEAPDRM